MKNTRKRTNAEITEMAKALTSGRDCPHLFKDLSWSDYDKALQKAENYNWEFTND